MAYSLVGISGEKSCDRLSLERRSRSRSRLLRLRDLLLSLRSRDPEKKLNNRCSKLSSLLIIAIIAILVSISLTWSASVSWTWTMASFVPMAISRTMIIGIKIGKIIEEEIWTYMAADRMKNQSIKQCSNFKSIPTSDPVTYLIYKLVTWLVMEFCLNITWNIIGN